MATKRQQELAAIIKKREQAVQRKVRRLENKGVRVGGTQHDPRRSPGTTGNMNAREMSSYIKNLESFTDRRVQFVPGVSGKPIPAQKWRQYKYWENRGNQFSLDYRKKIENVQLPDFKGEGVTLGQYREQKRGNLPSRLVPSVNDPFDVRGRISQGVPDEKSLDKLIASERKRSSPKHFEKWFNYSTVAAEKMLSKLGQTELLDKLKRLSPEQFHAFWEAGGNDVAANYVVAQNAFEDGDTPAWWQERSNQDDFEELHRLSDWASAIDLTDQQKPVKARGKVKHPNAVNIYTNTNAGPIETVGNANSETWAGPIPTQKGIKTRRLRDGDEAIISVDGKKMPKKKG